jgi:hypothetical protein
MLHIFSFTMPRFHIKTVRTITLEEGAIMIRAFRTLALFLASTSFTNISARADHRMCSEVADRAYDSAYWDCMNGGSGGGDCGYYTQHGYTACVNHGGCNWSMTSNECFQSEGMQCWEYTRHGYTACVNNHRCDWSMTSNECYVR